jgi:hypothetical protein
MMDDLEDLAFDVVMKCRPWAGQILALWAFKFARKPSKSQTLTLPTARLDAMEPAKSWRGCSDTYTL